MFQTQTGQEFGGGRAPGFPGDDLHTVCGLWVLDRCFQVARIK